jgi:4-amino-4-deoxychorismate lyase
MYRFIETIRLEHGVVPHLQWHQLRLDRTLTHFGWRTGICLEQLIHEKELPEQGVFKIRIVYGQQGVESFEHSAYLVKPINSVQLVELPEQQQYAFKFEDRNWLARLLKDAGTDDLLMHRQGKLLDASYANIALLIKGDWLTPLNPLLEGTCRARLLAEGKLKTAELSVKDLLDCDEIRWMNAILPWEEAPRMNRNEISQMIRV